MEELVTQYKRGMEHNYLIIKCEEEEPNDYQTKMLQENRIKNLLNLNVKRNNGSFDYYYEVSSLQPVSRIYERRQIGYEGILGIVNGILAGIRSAHEYMLDENMMLFSPDYLYMNVETKELSIMLYPYFSGTLHSSIMSLAEFILDKTDHNDNKAVMLAYDLFKTVRNDSFTVGNLDAIIEKVSGITRENTDNRTANTGYIDNDNTDMDVADDISIETYKYDKASGEFRMTSLWDDGYGMEDDRKTENESEKEPDSMPRRKSIFSSLFSSKKNKKQEEPIAIKEEPIYSYQEPETLYEPEENEMYGKTVLLTPEMNKPEDMGMPGKFIYKEGSKEKTISLSSLPITIGKVESCVDVVIKDSSLSRMHATIFKEDNQIKIRDLGSTNGTYVNDVMISEDDSMPLEEGDEIKLGKVSLRYV